MALPRHVLSKALEPGSSGVVDSTGLKVYGKDEWHQERHDAPARLTWRKLHLACEFTTPEVGEPTAVPDLLAQIDTPFETFMGDGAYDGDPVPKPYWPSSLAPVLSCHRTRQRCAQSAQTLSATGTVESSNSTGELPGKRRLTTACAATLSWQSNDTSESLDAS